MITVGLHCIALVFIHLLPESPRWLIMMNRVEDAEKIIRRACKNNKSSLPSDLGLNKEVYFTKCSKEPYQKNNESLMSYVATRHSRTLLVKVRHAEKRKWMKKDERPSYFHLFRAAELRVRNIILFLIWVCHISALFSRIPP
uniref:MFS domain-containing protein n=1 Tax=Angiostrongylus cantonensis TaxID=6313 RepID=A0A0K0D8C0_ANGCA